MARTPSGPLPEGFRYVREFVSAEEERALVERMADAAFREVRMRGQVALRRTAHYGWDYGYESWQITPAAPVPDWILPLRERAAALIGAAPAALEEVLVTEYPPGAGIGWHRDAPMFGPAVVGVSLGATARLRFRRAGVSSALLLEPRSAYVLDGPARKQWQHSIPGAKALRYSITFRTLKPAPQAAAGKSASRRSR
ncbi:MAG: alpha-ketoglutarate-dependent dioxygenase AlkB [Deltaproteobacteria bacterium]